MSQMWLGFARLLSVSGKNSACLTMMVACLSTSTVRGQDPAPKPWQIAWVEGVKFVVERSTRRFIAPRGTVIYTCDGDHFIEHKIGVGTTSKTGTIRKNLPERYTRICLLLDSKISPTLRTDGPIEASVKDEMGKLASGFRIVDEDGEALGKFVCAGLGTVEATSPMSKHRFLELFFEGAAVRRGERFLLDAEGGRALLEADVLTVMHRLLDEGWGVGDVGKEFGTQRIGQIAFGTDAERFMQEAEYKQLKELQISRWNTWKEELQNRERADNPDWRIAKISHANILSLGGPIQFAGPAELRGGFIYEGQSQFVDLNGLASSRMGIDPAAQDREPFDHMVVTLWLDEPLAWKDKNNHEAIYQSLQHFSIITSKDVPVGRLLLAMRSKDKDAHFVHLCFESTQLDKRGEWGKKKLPRWDIVGPKGYRSPLRADFNGVIDQMKAAGETDESIAAKFNALELFDLKGNKIQWGNSEVASAYEAAQPIEWENLSSSGSSEKVAENPPVQQSRKWTSVTGSTIKAELVEFRRGWVQLQIQGQKKPIAVQVIKLSKADQAFIADYAETVSRKELDLAKALQGVNPSKARKRFSEIVKNYPDTSAAAEAAATLADE